MTTTAIDLGSIKLASKRNKLSLTLRNSFSIWLPPTWSDTTTAAELCEASKGGGIWIAKAGGCRVDVSMRDGGGLVDASEVGDLVSECPVCWCLRLRCCGANTGVRFGKT